MKDKTVLFVDDEQHILGSLKRLLRKEDYRLLTAGSASECLEILKVQSVQLVVTDQRMPVMTGVELLQKLRVLYPDIVRVVFSGHAELHSIIDLVNKGEIYRFFPKPWNDDELKAVIRQSLSHYDILKQNSELIEETRRQNNELLRMNERLEEIVSDRTRSLQLSQEILESLPAAVIGISRERELVLANEYARKAVLSIRTALPGTDLDEIFPDEIIKWIDCEMDGGFSNGPAAFPWEDKYIRAQLSQLKNGECSRGLIMMFVIHDNSLGEIKFLEGRIIK